MLKPTLIFNGGEWRDLRRTPRLFAPIRTGVLNGNVDWDSLRFPVTIEGTFAERNPARKERKCQSLLHDAPAGKELAENARPATSHVADNAGKKTDAVDANGKYYPKTPLASDASPESRGWVLINEATKNLCAQWRKDGRSLYRDDTARLDERWRDGKCEFFAEIWQQIDALLFPAHEWAVGDEVECLDAKDFGTCFVIEATSIIKSIAKHPFWNSSNGDNLCAIFAGGRHHPISALRLIKAAERIKC